MKKELTKKQQEIIKFLYQFRFLNRIQIQKFLNHKYHKRVNDWLNDLTKKEYLNRIYSNKFGENTKPAIYYIGLRGISYLKTRGECTIEVIRKFYRERDRSQSFIDQCLLVANIVLDLKAAAEKSKLDPKVEYELSYLYATATDLSNPDYRFNFLSEQNTDLLVKKLKKKKMKGRTETTFYLFSIISPNLPRYSARHRVKNFIELYNGYDWDEVENHKFPEIMIICPNLQTLIYLKRLTKRLLEDEDNPKDLHFCFTTLDELTKKKATSEIWEPVN